MKNGHYSWRGVWKRSQCQASAREDPKHRTNQSANDATTLSLSHVADSILTTSRAQRALLLQTRQRQWDSVMASNLVQLIDVENIKIKCVS
jgi:hypothetical protein